MKGFIAKLILTLASISIFLTSSVSADQDTLALTITPPLIKNNVNPGESWASYIKVVNNNTEDINVYAHVFDFKSGPEGGVEFLNNNFTEKKEGEEISNFMLSDWIDIEREAISIKAHQSKEVPFAIKVPDGAEPGGHYAAILIGTKPSDSLEGSGLNVSSLLSSLIMLKVGGNIVEKADIKEFSLPKSVYSEPKVNFTVRFENSGNIHVQPRGEIKIYDFWGNEKGSIPINHNSSFGHVLPGSNRKWEFSWEGEKKILEMGKYRASLILSYGEEGNKTVYYDLNFWIIYWKFLISFILGVALFFALIVWMVRSSVRRAVKMAQRSAGIEVPESKMGTYVKRMNAPAPKNIKKKINSDKVVDLRSENKK